MNSVVPVLASESGLSNYLAEIKKFPLLSAQEEYMLARRFADHGDVEAAHKLVTSHLRLVAKIALGYRYYGLPISDLISEGNIGLMRAVKKFDPERGFRLTTYAIWWIKAAINEFVLASWSLVKMGTDAAQKKLFFNLRKLKARLGVYDEGDIPEPAAEKIAKRLSVETSEVIDMNRRMWGSDSSLNQIVGSDSDTERQELLADDTPDQEFQLAERQERLIRNGLLKAALSKLTPRERKIIEERRLTDNPRTLEEIGMDFGVSRERVRQLENRAFAKLQRSILEAANRFESKARPLPQLALACG